MEQVKKRFDEIDVAKGIGILLVVIGHCFPDVSTSEGISVPAFRVVHDVIYTFHMPLMFMLAGFLSQRVLRLDSIQNRGQYIGERFFRLMVPYFVIGLLYMPVKLVLSRFASQPYDLRTFWQITVGENPDGGLWYLWALFVVQMVLALFLTKKNATIVLMISAVISLAIVVFGLSFYRLDDAVYYAFFVLLGVFIGVGYETYRDKIGFIVIAVLIAIFCISVFFTVGKEIIVFKFLCGIAGSFIVLAISKLLSQSEWGGTAAYRVLKYLGQYSMDIYVMHGIVMVAIRIALWSILKINYYACTIAMLLGGLIIPVIISKFILRKSKVLAFLFLGEKTKRR